MVQSWTSWLLGYMVGWATQEKGDTLKKQQTQSFICAYNEEYHYFSGLYYTSSTMNLQVHCQGLPDRAEQNLKRNWALDYEFMAESNEKIQENVHTVTGY